MAGGLLALQLVNELALDVLAHSFAGDDEWGGKWEGKWEVGWMGRE